MDTIEFINHVATGDAAKAKETINDLISQAAFEALDLKKKEIAQNAFNTPVVEESVKHIDTAYSWHGGQNSALYSFASTGGKIHDENHREKLKKEISDNLKTVQNNPTVSDYKGEDKKLSSLLTHVSKKSI